VPVVPVDVPDAPECGPADVVPVDGDAVFDAGARIDSHGSFDADADCEVPRAVLGALLVVVPLLVAAVLLRDPGWSASAPVPERGPVSVAVFTGSLEDVVVPVELLARLDGEAAALALVPDVPVVPTAEGELPCAAAVRFVEPAVPAPAGPHGSVVLPMLVEGVVPVPWVEVVVVPEFVVLVRPLRPAGVPWV
jgi:hypothetical protein